MSAALQAHISEALVATAVGLFVAIPAVAAYNFFMRLVKGTLANTDALGHMLLSHLKSEEGSAAPAGARTAGSDDDDKPEPPPRSSKEKEKRKAADVDDADVEGR